MRASHKVPRRPTRTRAVFIAGTDTDIGKTVVTAAILSILRAHGADAVPMKPVQTGCLVSKGISTAPDLEFCLSATGLNPDIDELEQMAPYRFRPACSPHLAARLADCSISPDTVLERFSALHTKHDFVVIEGAGGILVPIGSRRTMLDIIRQLGAPVILVARSGLGTINHSLLSLIALRNAGVQVIGVVFNNATSARPGRIEKDNLRTVAGYGDVRILGSLPFARNMCRLQLSPAEFLKWAKSHLNLPVSELLRSKNEIRP
jgi:dethiobiotin synthetase